MKLRQVFLPMLALLGLLACAGEEFTDPKATSPTGGLLFDAALRASGTFSKPSDSAFCTIPIAGNVPSANYRDTLLQNGVFSIKLTAGTTLQQAANNPGFCPPNDHCACSEAERLAFTSPAVNSNRLVISGQVKMPNNAGGNVVVFDRAFRAALPEIGTASEDTILYRVILRRVSNNDAQAIVVRSLVPDGGAPQANSHPVDLANAFSGGDTRPFTISFTPVDPTKFKIDINVGGVAGNTEDKSVAITNPEGTVINPTPLITLGSLFNQVPTSAVSIALLSNQGATNTYNPANAPTIIGLKITQ